MKILKELAAIFRLIIAPALEVHLNRFRGAATMRLTLDNLKLIARVPRVK